MENFHEFGLNAVLTKALTAAKITEPTPIQAQAIPVALEGRDILGSAQTGTGKTLAFGLPLLTKLMEDKKSSALIITPTRELATQVMRALQKLIDKKRDGIRPALLIGGESINKQLAHMRTKPRLFVGTPGRINDHLMRGSLKLSSTKFLVLDETDRMLDMGFSVQIDKIIEHLPAERQTLLFSATLPQNIMMLTRTLLKDPARIAIGSPSLAAEKVTQVVMRVKDKDRYPTLVAELEKRSGSILIFMKTKYGTERMAKRLMNDGHEAAAIHGDLRHAKRERVIQRFRSKAFRILVATDVAARGLDIPHIEHVINYDLPQCPEDYIHRIGRTARAGASGEAVCFVKPADKGKWSEITKLMKTPIKEAPLPTYFPEEKRKKDPVLKSLEKDLSAKPRQNKKKPPFNKDKKDKRGSFSKKPTKKKQADKPQKATKRDWRETELEALLGEQPADGRRKEKKKDKKKKAAKKPFRFKAHDRKGKKKRDA